MFPKRFYPCLFLLLLSGGLLSRAALSGQDYEVRKSGSPKPEERLRRFSGKVKIGKELELTSNRLALIVDHFDLPDLAKRLTAESCQDYVLYPPAYQALPEALKAQLADVPYRLDLTLQPLQRGEVKIPSQFEGGSRVVLSAGKGDPFTKEGPSREVTDAGVILPSRMAAEPKELIVPGKVKNLPSGSDRLANLSSPQKVQRNDWPILVARWNALPLDTKRNVIQFKYLSRERRAQLVIANAPSAQVIDAEEDNVGKALADMVRHRDGGALEVSDREPTEDLAAFYSDLKLLAEKSNVGTGIHRSYLPTRFDYSFHYHVSVNGLPPNETLEPLAKAFAQRLTLNTLAQANVDLIMARGENVFERSVTSPLSAIQLRAPNRIEFRHHFGVLEDDLEYYLSHMTASDLDQSVSDVYKDLNALLTLEPEPEQDQRTAMEKDGMRPPSRKRTLDILRAAFTTPRGSEVAVPLFANTRFEALAALSTNAKRLPVAEWERNLHAELRRLGISQSELDPTTSGIGRGRLRSSDAFQPENLEATVQLVFEEMKRPDIAREYFWIKDDNNPLAKDASIITFMERLMAGSDFDILKFGTWASEIPARLNPDKVWRLAHRLNETSTPLLIKRAIAKAFKSVRITVNEKASIELIRGIAIPDDEIQSDISSGLTNMNREGLSIAETRELYEVFLRGSAGARVSCLKTLAYAPRRNSSLPEFWITGIRAAISDPDGRVRGAAIFAAYYERPRGVLAALESVMKKDPEDPLRSHALDALVELNPEASLSYVLEALRSGPDTLLLANNALQRLKEHPLTSQVQAALRGALTYPGITERNSGLVKSLLKKAAGECVLEGIELEANF